MHGWGKRVGWSSGRPQRHFKQWLTYTNSSPSNLPQRGYPASEVPHRIYIAMWGWLLSGGVAVPGPIPRSELQALLAVQIIATGFAGLRFLRQSRSGCRGLWKLQRSGGCSTGSYTIADCRGGSVKLCASRTDLNSREWLRFVAVHESDCGRFCCNSTGGSIALLGGGAPDAREERGRGTQGRRCGPGVRAVMR
jgi:hypothetical protein